MRRTNFAVILIGIVTSHWYVGSLRCLHSLLSSSLVQSPNGDCASGSIDPPCLHLCGPGMEWTPSSLIYQPPVTSGSLWL